MSGNDEVKPRCFYCKPCYTNGLDNRRLYARNSDGNNLNLITSDYDESLLGTRVVMFSNRRRTSENSVIDYIRCSNCGERLNAKDFVFKVKRYVWLYKDTFGMFHHEWERKINNIEYEDGEEELYIPTYDEYLGEDDLEDVCEECGYPYDECICEVCPRCGYNSDECMCDD